MQEDPDKTNNIRVIKRKDDNNYVVLLPVKAEKDVRLHILDMLGRELKDTIYKKLAVPGEIPMNGSDLREGLYFLRVNYGNTQWSAKMVKRDQEE